MQTKKKTLSYRFLFSSLLSLLLISSCAPTTPSVDTTSLSTDPTISSPSVSEEPSTTGTQPSISEEGSTSQPNENTPTEINFDVYTLNDFHGATKFVNQTYPEIGLAKLSTLFRSYAEENTSFFLSSGDMWQETIESNSNRGEYVTKAFNRIGLDAMTVGNHEFDWGTEYITKNAAIADYPFLAANIVEKSTGELIEGTVPSVLIDRDGVQVGVIGTIGPTQYSSISYQYAAMYEFEGEYNHVVSQAKYLREKGADIVILSAHDGYGSSDFTTLKKEMINDASIDMVIAGHTHTFQSEVYTRRDGKKVPLIQAYSSGTAYGHVNFTYNTEKEELELNTYAVKNFPNLNNVEEDQVILDLYKDNYDVDEMKAEVIGKAKTDFSREKLAILGSTAVYEKIKSMPEYEQYDILTCYHNSARNALGSGDITFEELFLSYPFDNEIIIYAVNSSYITKGWNYVHSGFNTNVSFTGKKYVAGIDYLAYKQVSLEDGIRTGLFVRDIVKEYIKNKKEITASDFYN